MGGVFTKLQKVGKALMLPVAVLPAAGLLLRLGAGDVPGISGTFATIIFKAGDGIFGPGQANLSLIFAIAIAFGIAKQNHGAAGLAGAIAYLVNKSVYTALAPELASLGVLDGICMGLLAGFLYNKYHSIKLPDYLQFFGGKRFVPIAAAFAAIFTGIFFGYSMPFIQGGLRAMSNVMGSTGAFGAFVYGLGNRLLIPVGMHHVLNSVIWTLVGEFTTATGEVIRGDLLRFLQGDPTAGALESGFYPIIMFGLPAAAFAMYRAAKPENRKGVAGMFASVGFTAFLTGVTEPIEFAFAFVAFPLFVVHAVLQGIASALTYALDIRMAFGFSGGLLDYLIFFKQSSDIGGNPFLLIPIGLGFAALYYTLFTWAIKKFDIPTPGRYDEVSEENENYVAEKGIANIAKEYVAILGGRDNIVDIDSCITRLRLTLKDNSRIDEKAIKRLGAAGVIKPNNKNVQVVVGTQAELIAEDMKRHLA